MSTLSSIFLFVALTCPLLCDNSAAESVAWPKTIRELITESDAIVLGTVSRATESAELRDTSNFKPRMDGNYRSQLSDVDTVRVVHANVNVDVVAKGLLRGTNLVLECLAPLEFGYRVAEPHVLMFLIRVRENVYHSVTYPDESYSIFFVGNPNTNYAPWFYGNVAASAVQFLDEEATIERIKRALGYVETFVVIKDIVSMEAGIGSSTFEKFIAFCRDVEDSRKPADQYQSETKRVWELLKTKQSGGITQRCQPAHCLISTNSIP